MSDSEQTQLPPVVAPRKNFRSEPVFVKATIADQAGARPGYVRQWVSASKDASHPNHVDKYTRERFVGDQSVGYCKAEPWTVVERKSARGRKRDDDTSGVDTTQTHGDLVLIETTEENAAIFSAYKQMKVESRGRALGTGETETNTADNGGKAVYKARLGQGTAMDDPKAILNQ